MNRREALQNLSAAAALFGIPAEAAAREKSPLPDEGLLARDPEKYWSRVRARQFLLPDWRAFLNNGSLGVTPVPVVKAVEDYLNRSAGLLMNEYPRWGYETMDEHRSVLADFMGCSKDELALTHSATESMSIIAGGMRLRTGDEVILTDQEHPSGVCPWKLRQARSGIEVREVQIPIPPESAEQILDILISAIGPKTRVLSFSGITTKTGLVMPIRRICDAAREKGVITVVDGAHMNGQIGFKISELGCDYFAGSPHKWLFAPAGCGILFVRDELIDDHYPMVATAGWDDKEIRAARYMRIGTNNRSVIEGFVAGARFAQSIGPDRIYGRIHDLGKLTLRHAGEMPNVEVLTSDDESMYAGLVTIRFQREDLNPLWELCQQRKIWTTEANPLRLATHIHTRPSDLELFFETVRDAFPNA